MDTGRYHKIPAEELYIYILCTEEEYSSISSRAARRALSMSHFLATYMQAKINNGKLRLSVMMRVALNLQED